MQYPEFTFIIPVRNGEPYITATIDSILNQEFADFKVIILENGSTDNTLAVLNGYQDERLQIIPAAGPLGIQQNWARILDLSLSGFITIAGHDDIFYPRFLVEIMALIQAHPQASLHYSHFNFIDNAGNILKRCKPIPYRETGDAFLQARQRLNRDMYGTGYVMRFADYKAVGGFPDHPGLYYADELVFYRLAQISEKVCSPETLFGYRYHRESASFKIGLEALYEASSRYWKALSQTPYFQSDQNKQLAAHYIGRMFSRRYHRLLLDLLKSADQAQIKNYQTTKKAILERARADRAFSIYDPLSRVLERLLYLPTRKLNRVLTGIIERGAVLTRSIRK